MALKPCKECNKKISTLAKVCPSCGAPSPTRKINSSIKKKDPNDDLWDQFGKGTLDLGVAFWLFGIAVSFVGSFILSYLGATYDAFFWWWMYGLLNVYILVNLASCAETHKEIQISNGESTVWAILVQVYCGIGALSLLLVAYNVIKGWL